RSPALRNSIGTPCIKGRVPGSVVPGPVVARGGGHDVCSRVRIARRRRPAPGATAPVGFAMRFEAMSILADLLSTLFERRYASDGEKDDRPLFELFHDLLTSRGDVSGVN